MKRKPKISCLMVTKTNRHRFPLFQRSLRNYLEQTYSNRELVIVADPRFQSALKKIEKLIHSLGRTDIKLVRPSRSVTTLGALRNLSIQKASGSVFDPTAAFRVGKKVRVFSEGVLLYRDQNHLTEAGSLLVAEKWKKSLCFGSSQKSSLKHSSSSSER